jgi:hypothetical protein
MRLVGPPQVGRGQAAASLSVAVVADHRSCRSKLALAFLEVADGADPGGWRWRSAAALGHAAADKSGPPDLVVGV